MPAGRPSKYKKVITHQHGEGILDLGQLEILAEYGLTNEQIANILNIHTETLKTFKDKNKKLFDVLNEGKSIADAQVQASLFKRANGYHYTDTAFDKDGKETSHTTRYEAPNTAACIYWLNNRQREKWNNQQYIPIPENSFPTEVVFQIKETNGVEEETK